MAETKNATGPHTRQEKHLQQIWRWAWEFQEGSEDNAKLEVNTKEQRQVSQMKKGGRAEQPATVF